MFYDTFHKLCLDKGVSDSRACTDMGLSRSYAAKMKNKDGPPSMDNTGFHRRKFLAIEVKVYADVKHDEVSWYCNNEGDSKPISQQYGKGSDQKKHNINFGAPHHTAFKFIHENTTLLNI